MSSEGAQIAHDARVTWQGTLSDGEGRITDGGAPDGSAMSWAARVKAEAQPASASTSPEELIAAAHAGCYSMSLAHVLEGAGHRAEHLDVQARCTAGLADGGLAIQSIVLTVRGSVPGLDPGEFGRLADEAERQCPVSNSLRGNVEIRLDALLVDPVA
jgi:osmotically inducible protein OsmC